MRLAQPSLPAASGLTGLPPLPSPGPAEAPPTAAAALLGARPEQLLGRFGAPEMRRQEEGAQVWLYVTPACRLDLVLYPEGGTVRVAHAQARANGLASRTEAACLSEIGARGRSHGRPAPSGRLPPAADGTGAA